MVSRLGTRTVRAFACAFLIALLPGCFELGAHSTFGQAPANRAPANRSLKVSWSAARETAVNASGGGYIVYYATSPGVVTSGSTAHVSVPYVSGAQAPTQITLTGLTPGTYSIRVVAFSALSPPGGSSGNRSADSAESTVSVQ